MSVAHYDTRQRSSQVLLELGSTKPSDHQNKPLQQKNLVLEVHPANGYNNPYLVRHRQQQHQRQQQQQQQQQQQSLISQQSQQSQQSSQQSLKSLKSLKYLKSKPSQHSKPTKPSQQPERPSAQQDKTMYTPMRRNSLNVPTSPPSPFFDRQEFLDAIPPSPSSSVPSPPLSPMSPTSPVNRVSKVFTDPFSDSHRASVLSTISAVAIPDDLTINRSIRTPSISSIVSLSSRGSLPNFDIHVMYKIKTTNSSKKLSSFFGEQIPLDVGVKEIERGGLGALLHSKVPLCYFLRFLLDEYSSENLFFFIEVEQYESFKYHSRAQQLATAQHIYETYLTRNSQFEVNVEDRVRKAVITALRDQHDLLRCFDPAKRAVFSLLEGSYTRHRLSSGWDRMVREIGENTIHYDETARNMAVNHLLEHIARQHDTLFTNPHTDALISNNSRRRHELLKSMIHEFCRSMLGVDFDYYRPEPQYSKPSPISDTRSPAVHSDGEGSSEGEGVGGKSSHSRQHSRSFVGKKNKEKLEVLFGKMGKTKSPESSKV